MVPSMENQRDKKIDMETEMLWFLEIKDIRSWVGLVIMVFGEGIQGSLDSCESE